MPGADSCAPARRLKATAMAAMDNAAGSGMRGRTINERGDIFDFSSALAGSALCKAVGNNGRPVSNGSN